MEKKETKAVLLLHQCALTFLKGNLHCKSMFVKFVNGDAVYYKTQPSYVSQNLTFSVRMDATYSNCPFRNASRSVLFLRKHFHAMGLSKELKGKQFV